MNFKSTSWLLLLLVTACATQKYEPSPLQPQQAMEAFAARSLSDAGLGEPSSWGLTELTKAALRLHPDLNVARAQWRAAQASEKTAAEKPNPTLSAGSEHHSQHKGVTPWTLGLGIDIPIEAQGKREARIAQAQALSEVARLDIAQVAWNVRSRLRARFLELYEIAQQVEQLQKEENLRNKIVLLLEARVTAGMSAGTDLSDARLEWQKTQMLLDAERSREDEARANLAAAIGIPDHALENLPLTFAAFEHIGEKMPSREVQRAALLNRIEIRKALAGYEEKEARLRLEIAKQHSDLNLSPGVSWDQADFKWSLGLSLLLALMNKNEGPIAEAQAAREVEAKKFIALQTDIIGELSIAYSRWQSAQNDISKARRLVTAQSARLSQTQRQFDAGYGDRLELTTAQLALVSAESAVLAARLKTLRALGTLEDAVQQPLDGSEPLTEQPESQAQDV